MLRDDSSMESIVSTTWKTTAPPFVATTEAAAARASAWCALSALFITVAVSSSIDDAVSSSDPARCFVRADRSRYRWRFALCWPPDGPPFFQAQLVSAPPCGRAVLAAWDGNSGILWRRPVCCWMVACGVPSSQTVAHGDFARCARAGPRRLAGTRPGIASCRGWPNTVSRSTAPQHHHEPIGAQ